jgi:hypothetical protein
MRSKNEEDSVSLQRRALDEISHKLAVAQKACQAVSEILEVMTELAELVEHLGDQPAPAVAAMLNSTGKRVENKLAALSLFQAQLNGMKTRALVRRPIVA